MTLLKHILTSIVIALAVTLWAMALVMVPQELLPYGLFYCFLFIFSMLGAAVGAVAYYIEREREKEREDYYHDWL